MISIITRCRNRLEYTAQVVDAVRRNTTIPYEHIIVDNASTDGTYEWFTWMSKNTSFYGDTIRYCRMDRNTGDWGGMLVGFELAKGDYIVQLDNDIIPCKGWLKDMVSVLVNTSYKGVMLKRKNVVGRWVLKPMSPVKNIGGLEVARVSKLVACFMIHRGYFDGVSKAIPESKGMVSKPNMAKMLFPLAKIQNRYCHELQALEGQRTKYNPKNPEVWEKV